MEPWKGLTPFQVALFIAFVKLLAALLVQSWYVPDEYWQTLEIAHKQVFGYGAVTWEWQKGIRNYLYPSVVAALFTVLKFLRLDSADAVVLVPRLFQAFISGVADYNFYQWTGQRKWALFLHLSSWFWFYTCSRTLLQTVETSFVTIALSNFPFKSGILSQYQKESNLWIWLAAVTVFVRPTSAPLWIVLGAYNLLTTNQGRLRLFFRSYIPICATVASALIAWDSYLHGSFIITPWEFFRFNILHDIASFYGQHPWYWYLTQGLPAVLGINIIPALIGIFNILRRPKEHQTGLVLLIAAALHVALYSAIPHKEFRFVLPLLPIFVYIAQDVIVRWSRKAGFLQLYLVAGIIVLANVIPGFYFSVVHQAGTIRVMPAVRQMVNEQSSIVFLMPCHSTPLYSHLHVNATTRYLNCDPPFNKVGETYESEYFYNNPLRWWRTEYNGKRTPDVIVTFDKLRGRIENILEGYSLVHELPHTQFPEGEVGANVLVYEKKPKTDTPA